jgi:hypothetical protein
VAEVTDITSIPLYQILGAPLMAIVQAEVQAAQATVEFIEKVGFKRVAEGHPENHYGDLETVTFKYSKTGVGGTVVDFKVEIPLISIVPIPAIQISDAKIDFAVEVNDAVKIDSKVKLSVPKDKAQDNSIESDLVLFKAGIASRDSKTAMHVTINVKQADTPVGMQALFRVMEQGISSVSQDPEDTKDKSPSK